MEIKLKFEEVLKINNTLKTIIEYTKTKINVLLKFRLLGIMKTIEPFVSSFEVIRNEKIIEYGKENKDGIFQIHKDDKVALAKYKNDIEQVLDSEVTLNIELLKANEVFDSGLRSDHLMGLFPIISGNNSN